jgi:hypothetical protein
MRGRQRRSRLIDMAVDAARFSGASTARARWSDAEDEILGGDLTAALAYLTPAGGAVLTPVAPLGLRDRDAGTVTFTTSLGFGRKLERIERDPRVALAYHAREHGHATGTSFVLVQGVASFDLRPDPSLLAQFVLPAAARFTGEPKSGWFWDRWLRAYYADRVLVTVAVARVSSWPDLACRGESTVVGEPAPGAAPAAQLPPRGGTEPRLDPGLAQRRMRRLPHVLLAYRGADGFPVIAPVTVGRRAPGGIELAGDLPPGGRRAGLLGHRYGPQLIGLESRQYTGWLQDGRYAPHTERSLRAPANKTLLLLANGLAARRGVRRRAAPAPSTRARGRRDPPRDRQVMPHRAFDPRGVGELEARAWIAYYRREWAALLRASIGLTRETFGLPWPLALRGAWLVLRANQLWAPFPDNDPDGARAAMQRFYRLIARRHGEPANPALAARLEVEWWRVHRQHQHGDDASEAELVDALASLYAYVYAVPAASVTAAAEQRALAMRYSDEWVDGGCDIASPLIVQLRAALVRSYASLLAAIHRP